MSSAARIKSEAADCHHHHHHVRLLTISTDVVVLMRSWMSHTIKEREKDASVVRLEEEARAREDHSSRFAWLLTKMDDERGQYTKTEQYGV